MNQRSLSFRQDKKTLHNDISFEKRISKVMRQKKNTINNMANQKHPSQHMLSYRLSPFSRNKQNLKTEQPHASVEKNQNIMLSQQMVKEYLAEENIDEGVCVNHRLKKAAFEQKQDSNRLYCHECAIKMVKSNIKVVGISQHSLLFKSLLNKEIDKINQEENNLRQTIQQHYKQIRENFHDFYLQFLQERAYQPEFIDFGEFKTDSKVIEKVKQQLGKLQEVKFKLIPPNEKQSYITRDSKDKENVKGEINKGRTLKNRHNLYEKDLMVQISIESNRSLGLNSNREEKRSYRGRQNSQYRKNIFGEPRKMLNLR